MDEDAQTHVQGPARERGAGILRRVKVDVVHGSGNVFWDLGAEDADLQQLKAILAAGILKLLEREKLTVRAAQAQTGIAAADFSRIRNADLGRFTADRLMVILNRLGLRVEVKVRMRPGRTTSSSTSCPRRPIRSTCLCC